MKKENKNWFARHFAPQGVPLSGYEWFFYALGLAGIVGWLFWVFQGISFFGRKDKSDPFFGKRFHVNTYWFGYIVMFMGAFWFLTGETLPILSAILGGVIMMGVDLYSNKQH